MPDIKTISMLSTKYISCFKIHFQHGREVMKDTRAQWQYEIISIPSTNALTYLRYEGFKMFGKNCNRNNIYHRRLLYRADKSYLHFAVLVPEVKHPACSTILILLDNNKSSYSIRILILWWHFCCNWTIKTGNR